MKDKTTKSVFRMFFDMTGQKEERWLSRMARQGWFLKKVPLLFYRFVKGAPGDWIYRIDYRGGAKVDRQEYLGLFKDAGWDYVTAAAGRFYFRIRAGAGPAPEIFTDMESRLAMYRRVLAGLTVFMVIMLLDINSILMNRKHPGGFWVLVLVLLSALAAFFAFGVFRMLALVSRLKKGQAQTASGKAKRR